MLRPVLRAPAAPCVRLNAARRLRHTSNLYPTYLAEDVDAVGKRGDIVMLRAGFARNFIVGTQKGLMLPRSERDFRPHMDTYRRLGFPIQTMTKFYDGEVKAKGKGEAFKQSVLGAMAQQRGSADTATAAEAAASAAQLAEAYSEVAQALRDSVSATPVKIDVKVDNKRNIYGSVEPKTLYNELKRRGIAGFELAVKHVDQIAFIVTDEEGAKVKTRKVKQLGRFQAVISIPRVGKVSFDVELVPSSAIYEGPTTHLSHLNKVPTSFQPSAATGDALMSESPSEPIPQGSDASSAPPKAPPRPSPSTSLFEE